MCIAKKLSGYRSSPSESSDSHCTETASRRRKTPNQFQRNETDAVKDASEMNPVDTDDGTAPADDLSTSCTSQLVTESTNVMSSGKDSVTTSANQDSSERMQIDVVSGTCSTSSLVSSCNNSATTFGSQVRPEEMEADATAAAAPSSILKGASNGSVSMIANKDSSEGVQAGVISASSSIVTSSSNDSVAAIPNKDMSDETQADVPSGASSTLMTSRDDPVSTIANEEGTQASAASAGSSTLMTSRNKSTAVVTCIGRAGGIHDEITTPLASTNVQEHMDWEPAGVESLTERDLEPEQNCENTRNNFTGTDHSLLTEDGPKDKRCSSESPENSSTSLPQRINAEMVSTALTAVSGSDSFEDDTPLSLLAEVSSSVKKAKVSVTRRSQRTKKKKRKGMTKNSGTPVDDGPVAELNYGSEEIVSVLQPDPPATALKGISNNGDINEDVDAMGSKGFPGMDDVLQVIIEEEENAHDSSHLETGLQTADVNMEDECIEINSPGDSSEERKSESICSKAQEMSSPREELQSNERGESGGNLLLACANHEKTNSNDGALPDEQDDMEVDSFCEVSNDYGNISSGEESISVLEQQASTCSSLNALGAHDKGINKQSCKESRKIGKSRAVARDPDGNESQVTREGRTSPNLTAEINNAGDLPSTVEIPNDRSVPRTLPQSNSKSLRQKNKKNAGAKGSVNEGSSNASAVPAVPSTVKSTGKSSHRASQLNGNMSEMSDTETETEGNSQTIQKLKKESHENVSKAKFRSRGNMFACDLQTLELLWNFKGR